MSNFLKLAISGVQNLSPYIPGKPIEALEREYNITNAIKLASNENPYGPSRLVVNKLTEFITHPVELSRYPDGSGFRLKEKIANFIGLKSDQITLGNGSNDVLDIISRCFASAGDEVIFSQYAFAVYPICTQAVGATAVITPAKEWGHDLNAMSLAITPKTKLIFIANPNNPTGTCLTGSEIEQFLKQLPDNVIVVIDEAYMEYASHQLSPWKNSYQASDYLLSQYDNLIITRTFSKAYGLASLRVGFSLSCVEIADLLNRVRQPFNNNSLALEAASAALEDQDYLYKTIALNWSEMHFIESKLKQLSLNYIPSAGNFICLDISSLAISNVSRNNLQETPYVMQLYEKLLQQGVITRPVINYNMPDHLRVTIGKSEENQKFISAIESLTL